jgi:DNA-binding transcriptional regulator YhcF (GntR family)
MPTQPFRFMNPDRYDIATEVLSSAIRVLQATGFSEEEIPKLFQQVADRRARVPLWIDPPVVADSSQ